jgi:hypothetical protein
LSRLAGVRNRSAVVHARHGNQPTLRAGSAFREQRGSTQTYRHGRVKPRRSREQLFLRHAKQVLQAAAGRGEETLGTVGVERGKATEKRLGIGALCLQELRPRAVRASDGTTRPALELGGWPSLRVVTAAPPATVTLSLKLRTTNSEQYFDDVRETHGWECNLTQPARSQARRAQSLTLIATEATRPQTDAARRSCSVWKVGFERLRRVSDQDCAAADPHLCRRRVQNKNHSDALVAVREHRLHRR